MDLGGEQDKPFFGRELWAAGHISELFSQMQGGIHKAPERDSLREDFCKTHHLWSNMAEVKIHTKTYTPFIFYH